MKYVLLMLVLLFTGCSSVSLKDCSKSCRLGQLKEFMNDEVVCKCASWDF